MRLRFFPYMTSLALVGFLALTSAPRESTAQCISTTEILLTDADGFEWDIMTTGAISNGSIDSYDVGMALLIDGAFFPESAQVTELNGRQVVSGPEVMSGLEITRRVYVPDTDGWARFLEHLDNPTGADITVAVRIETNPGSDSGTVITGSYSGDQTLDLNDHWLTTDDGSDGAGDPSLTHSYWGDGAAVTTATVGMTVFDCASADGPTAEFSVTVPAGGSAIVMHFAAQSQNRADSITKANTIDLLPPETLVGIPPEDIPLIVNWGLAFCGDGNVSVGEDCDDGNTVDDGNGCDAACLRNDVCGDGAVQDLFEGCDDGNDVDDGNGCDAACQRNDVCGDGVVQDLYEECDDGNAADDGNGCDDACQRNDACGDGVVQDLYEECDDGNTADNDGCSSTCTVEDLPPDAGPTPPDAAGAPDAGDGGGDVDGCCQSSSPLDSVPPLALILLGVLLIFRRRRPIVG